MSYAIYKCYNCSDNSSDPFNCPDNFINRYTHEETLVGWPEAKVFWEKQSGLSLGIAALTSFPPDWSSSTRDRISSAHQTLAGLLTEFGNKNPAWFAGFRADISHFLEYFLNPHKLFTVRADTMLTWYNGKSCHNDSRSLWLSEAGKELALFPASSILIVDILYGETMHNGRERVIEGGVSSNGLRDLLLMHNSHASEVIIVLSVAA